MSPSVTNRARTVLLVDDDDDGRATMASVLRGRGHEVVEAGGCREALEVLVADTTREPDLVLLSMDLPDGSAWEFLSITKGYLRLSRIPIAALGTARPPDLARYAAVIAFLERPVREEELLALTEGS